MERVRIGVIGIGNMGAGHAQNLLDGKIQRAELTAIADPRPPAALANKTKVFARSDDLIRSGLVDAVIIATPHTSHAEIGIAALQQGLHVLMEKPLTVHKAEGQRLLAAHTNPRQIFAEMFQLRASAAFQKIRQLVQAGELGEVRRVNWVATNWFRTETYYAASDWRATWAGEGGGVLLNQCPHQLDLFQWIFGMPRRVRGFCQLGRYHTIEVEDDVTAYFEFDSGATAVFITSTGEAPGTGRLEITGERGRLVYESDRLTLTRNEIPMTEFSRTTTAQFATPPVTHTDIPVSPLVGQHVEIMQNFVDAILDPDAASGLIAPAAEGLASVELANAILYSSFQEKTIELPLDAVGYEQHLQKLIANSKFQKRVNKQDASTTDFAQSHK